MLELNFMNSENFPKASQEIVPRPWLFLHNSLWNFDYLSTTAILGGSLVVKYY